MADTRFPIFRREGGSTEDKFGPIFMAIVATYFLWGIQVTQSYHYYKTFRHSDRLGLKLAVAFLFVADAAHTVCASEGAWAVLISSWGDTERVNHLSPGLTMVPGTGAITASIVHCFYAQKIWKLLNPPYNHFCMCMVVCFSGVQLVAGVGESIFGIRAKVTFTTFYRFSTWATLWFVGASVTDIVITMLMTWKLSKSRTAYKETNEIISKLIRVTVETGLATSVVQILCVIIQHVWPTRSYVVFPGEITAKLYSNSMMALLNSRRSPDSHSGQGGSKPYTMSESIHLEVIPGGGTIETKRYTAHTSNDMLSAKALYLVPKDDAA